MVDTKTMSDSIFKTYRFFFLKMAWIFEDLRIVQLYDMNLNLYRKQEIVT